MGGTFSFAQDEAPPPHDNGAPAPSAEKPNVAEAIAREVRAVFKSCRGAVVKIEGTDEHGPLSGTGFFIDSNGTIYTSFTIGGDTRDLVVSFGDKRYPAQRLLADVRSGVAILKVEASNTPFLLPARESRLELASPVVVVGYPMDLPLTPSFGTVAGFDIKYLGRYFSTTHIRANAPVQRGQGGAPLLNMQGEVVGLCISSLDQGSALFALPIEAAEKVRRDYLRFGKLRQGWLGVRVGIAERAVNGSNAEVVELFNDAPGEEVGLEKGDILLEVGGRRIRSPEDVLDAAFFITAEEPLRIKVAREFEVEEFTVVPTERQVDFASGPMSPMEPEPSSDLRAPLKMRIRQR